MKLITTLISCTLVSLSLCVRATAAESCKNVVDEQIKLHKVFGSAAINIASECDTHGDKSPLCRKMITEYQQLKNANSKTVGAIRQTCPKEWPDLEAAVLDHTMLWSKTIAPRDIDNGTWRGCLVWRHSGIEYARNVTKYTREDCLKEKDPCDYMNCRSL